MATFSAIGGGSVTSMSTATSGSSEPLCGRTSIVPSRQSRRACFGFSRLQETVYDGPAESLALVRLVPRSRRMWRSAHWSDHSSFFLGLTNKNTGSCSPFSPFFGPDRCPPRPFTMQNKQTPSSSWAKTS